MVTAFFIFVTEHLHRVHTRRLSCSAPSLDYRDSSLPNLQPDRAATAALASVPYQQDRQ